MVADLENNQRMGEKNNNARHEPPFSSLLRHRLDDNQRLGVYHAGVGHVAVHPLDDGGGGRISCSFVDSLYSRKDHYGNDSPGAYEAAFSERRKNAGPSARAV